MNANISALEIHNTGSSLHLIVYFKKLKEKLTLGDGYLDVIRDSAAVLHEQSIIVKDQVRSLSLPLSVDAESSIKLILEANKLAGELYLEVISDIEAGSASIDDRAFIYNQYLATKVDVIFISATAFYVLPAKYWLTLHRSFYKAQVNGYSTVILREPMCEGLCHAASDMYKIILLFHLSRPNTHNTDESSYVQESLPQWVN